LVDAVSLGVIDDQVTPVSVDLQMAPLSETGKVGSASLTVGREVANMNRPVPEMDTKDQSACGVPAVTRDHEVPALVERRRPPLLAAGSEAP